MADEILTEIISESEDGFEQIRLTVNEFRNEQYLHLRRYYFDFDETWQPTNKGIAIPMTISNIANLFNGLTKMLAHSDVLHIILEHSSDANKELIYDTLAKSFNGKS